MTARNSGINMERTIRPRPAFQLAAAGLTDIGSVRSSNEDAFLADTSLGLFIVADGMGGRNAGEVAAKAVVEGLPWLLDRRLRDMLDAVSSRAKRGACPAVPAVASSRRRELVEGISSPLGEAGDSSSRTRGASGFGMTALNRDVDTPRCTSRGVLRALKDAVLDLNAAIRASGQRSASLHGMGSTLACLFLHGGTACIANMGDSRVYRWRKGLKCLTQDHSLSALLLSDGVISRQAAARHPGRGQLTRFVGMQQEVYPDIISVRLRRGDRFLICTDGLWNVLPDKRIAELLAADAEPDVICANLIAAAKAAGSEDNITAVVVVVRSASEDAVGAAAVARTTDVRDMKGTLFERGRKAVSLERMRNAIRQRAGKQM